MLYTIACNSCGQLIACEPDGADMEAAISAEEDRAGVTFDRTGVTIESGLILTDDLQNGDRVRYSGTKMGWLTDKNGRSYEYAVRRAKDV